MADTRVTVIGSINMDLAVRAPQLPHPGETVFAHGITEWPGGKGANQAVASARLGARVAMIGRVGDDQAGAQLIRLLANEGIDVSEVKMSSDQSSGVAIVTVDDEGENSIVVSAGANAQLKPADAEAGELLIAAADVLLIQLESPLETVATAAELARRYRVPMVLDPAPVPSSPLPEVLQHATIICPNRQEATALTGCETRSREEAMEAAKELQSAGASEAIVTLGADGAVWCDENGCHHAPGFAVEAVDATAAGDAFAAGLAVSLAQEQPLMQAVRFACAAGALAACQPGAQASMPRLKDVQRLLQQQS